MNIAASTDERKRRGLNKFVFLASLCLLVPCTLAQADDVPSPVPRPASETERVPTPPIRPDTEADSDTESDGDQEDTPDSAEEREAADLPEAAEDTEKTEEEAQESKPERPPYAGPDYPPEQLRACLTELAGFGVTFERTPPLSGEGACGISDPVSVTALPGGIAVRPAATLNCPTALAFARWTSQVAVPAASLFLTAFPTEVRTGSGYACRGRNRKAGAKLSEHAFGNAIDITGIVFSDGGDWSVSPLEDDDESGPAQFQRTVREVSCGLFKTVLGPGSDGYHENHFHFDLAQRRGGGTYCR